MEISSSDMQSSALSFPLWVVKPSKKKTAARLTDCHDSLLWMDRYDDSPGKWDTNRLLAQEIWGRGDPKLLKLFRLSNGRLRRNELAYFYLNRRFKFLTALSEGTDFQEIVYQWLGILPTENNDLVTLDSFFEEHGNIQLTEDLTKELRTIIVTAHLNAGFAELQPKRVETHGSNALNNRLKRLGFPYHIAEKDSTWVLEKLEGDQAHG